ncbi:MAG: hypothetical protein GY754_16145 [bacterium]|nr:hypothetical protein [bacterium]
MIKKIMSYSYILLFSSIFIFYVSIAASAQNEAGTQLKPVEVNDSFTGKSLGTDLEILEDSKQELNIETVTTSKISKKFVKSKDKSPNFGFTTSVYWVRFILKSGLQKDKDLLLELDYPLMEQITLYIPKPGGGYTPHEAGYLLPFDARDIKHRNFVFKLELPASKSRTYYIRFENEDRLEIPLKLWTTDSFQEKDHTEQYVLGIYYGIFIVMFLYNLFLFLSIRDITYLYYILYILGFGFLQLTQNGLAYEYIWPGFLSIHYIPLLDTVLSISVIQFTQLFLKTKSNNQVFHKIFFILKIIFIIYAIFSFFLSYSLCIVIVNTLVAASIVCILSVASVSLYRKYRPAKYFIFAWCALLFGSIVYILRNSAVIETTFFSTYAMQVGSAMEVILLSLGLGDRINQEREKKQKAEQEAVEARERELATVRQSKSEVEDANLQLSLSEEKYRVLVEGSSDIIFTLDEDLNFVTANQAIKRELRLDPDSIQKVNFMDMIYTEVEGETVEKQLVQEKLKGFVDEREPISFATELLPREGIEPKLMMVRLEYLDIEGKNEILGKASSMVEDTLIRNFIYEKQRYSIGNFLVTSEEISHRLTRNLRRYMDPREINMLRVALREILINAIEHGNLEISFNDKTEAILKGDYLKFVAARQRNPNYSERRVMIEHIINTKKVAYKITDEGPGFDHQKILESDAEELNENMMAHGRGIMMAQDLFDEIQYNRKGNQVLLVKYF